jgi:uncharacterized membrane protein
MKTGIRNLQLALMLVSALGIVRAQNETYSFLYKDGNPIFSLQRTNNHGVTVGAFGFGGILYKDGNYTLFALPGSNIQSPTVSDINDKGEIVGEYFTPSGVGFFLRNGLITIIAVPGGTRTVPQGLNNHGTVVGTVRVPNERNKGFIFKDGAYTTVTVPGGGVNIWDINDNGDAVGEVDVSIDVAYSFLYRNGELTPIPNFPGVDRTRVFSINKTGEMVGMLLINTPGEPQRQIGFILRNGVFETFRLAGSLSFVPFGITDKGDVTGSYFTTNIEGTTFIRHAKTARVE